ncbi:MAG: Transcriptional regulatory protein ZraR [bacterium ADurb.Bin236]|nr:MAG: Transcriptional regulatory protein ZraR [bacterium ADurb.Bin236]
MKLFADGRAMAEKILIVDDKQSIVEILETALSDAGYVTDTAMSGEEALSKLSGNGYDLALCDVRLPDIDGMMILEKAMAGPNPPSFVMMTAYGSIQNAIESMKLGADDYVTKPFNLDEIRQVVKKSLERVRLKRENVSLKEQLGRRYDFPGIIGKSKQMMEVLEKVRRVAPSTATVLITGDSGVGKELVARAIHQNSPRAAEKFVALNCAAIPENLLESELFGHAKGAFTGAFAERKGMFEEANGGTLLLDEIAELHPSLQAKLLRTLDDNFIRRVGGNANIPVDVRLICSTNRNLAEDVEKKIFRLDLYHRIKVVEIHIAPLRDRKEDIMPLAEHFLREVCEEHGLRASGFSQDAVKAMLAHPWVGNVRELANAIEQAALMTEGDEITAERLSFLSEERCSALSAQIVEGETLKTAMGKIEKEIIARALEHTGGNRKDTAKKLGLSERALYYKLDEYGLK